MGRGPRKLSVSFHAKGLTHYGGVYLLHRFLSRLGFKKALASEVRFAQRNNRYSSGELTMALLYPMVLGLGRIETTQLLRHNGVFQYLTGLAAYPEPTTLRRYLLRAAPSVLPKIRTLHDRVLHRVTRRPETPRRLIFDVDSTVVVVYGKQEQAAIGYNPTKRGRRSYHPLLCFEGQSRDFWHGELRRGDAHTATGVVDLLEECFRKIPFGVRDVIVRADKGFYGHTLVEWLESQRARFVIVARLTRPIKRRLPQVRYRKVAKGIEVGEFRYQPARWPRPFRFVVVRRQQLEEESAQLTLFKLGRFHYQVLVTNLSWQPMNLWRFYNDRAGIELVIRQLKGDYALGKIPTHHFFVNEAYFHLLLLAYNLVNWFKRLCLPSDWQRLTLETLRRRLFFVPAQLVRTNNRPRLSLRVTPATEAAWKFATKRLDQLKL